MLVTSEPWYRNIDSHDYAYLEFDENSVVNNILPVKINITKVSVICTNELGILPMMNVLSSINMNKLIISGWTWPRSLDNIQVKTLEFAGRKYCSRELPILPRTIKKLIIGRTFEMYPIFHKEIYSNCTYLTKYSGPKMHHYIEHDMNYAELCADFIKFVEQNKK